MTPPTDKANERYRRQMIVLGDLLELDLPLLATFSGRSCGLSLQPDTVWISDEWLHRVDDEASKRDFYRWAEAIGATVTESPRIEGAGVFLDARATVNGVPVEIYGSLSCRTPCGQYGCDGVQVNRVTGVCPDCGHEYGPAPEFAKDDDQCQCCADERGCQGCDRCHQERNQA